MIARYSTPEMSKIWQEENKLAVWLAVEVAATEAMAELGYVPQEAVDVIKAKADFSVERTLEIEKETHHDVIAFLTNVAEHVGEEARFLHMGMTSSDMLDTALAVQAKQASELLFQEIDSLLAILKRRAQEFKMTPCIGRSHGIHAEPVTFGLKLALWYDEMQRNRKRLEEAAAQIAIGQYSGAVGTFAHIDPEVQQRACRKLGLTPANISTQIIQRDRHAHYLTTLAVIASSIEKFATEIRNLQRTEILEVEEFFASGQKGSSAMPHKRNPVKCEQLCGLARLIRTNSMAAIENNCLWHERDISHSSVERVIFPDSTILLHYMLRRFNAVVDKLIVYPDNMMRNIERTHGLIFSQQFLLALVNAGLTREKAYKIVQRNAMRSWNEGLDFQQLLLEDAEIAQYLQPDQIQAEFSLAKHLRHVDTIFERVGI